MGDKPRRRIVELFNCLWLRAVRGVKALKNSECSVSVPPHPAGIPQVRRRRGTMELALIRIDALVSASGGVMQGLGTSLATASQVIENVQLGQPVLITTDFLKFLFVFWLITVAAAACMALALHVKVAECVQRRKQKIPHHNQEVPPPPQPLHNQHHNHQHNQQHLKRLDLEKVWVCDGGSKVHLSLACAGTTEEQRLRMAYNTKDVCKHCVGLLNTKLIQ